MKNTDYEVYVGKQKDILSNYYDQHKYDIILKSCNETRVREEADTRARVVNNGWESDSKAYEFNSRSVNNTYVALFDRFLNSSL